MFNRKWKNLSPVRKKAFAVALTAAVVSNTLNIGSVIVNADTSARGRVITSFEELPDDIAYQFLEVGSEESDIVFPDELNVTLYSLEDEKEEPSEEETVEEPSEESPEEEPGAEEPSEEAPEEEPSTEAPAEEPAVEEPSTEAPEETPSEEAPAEEPSTEAPAEEPAVEEPKTEAPSEETPAEEPAKEEPSEEKPSEETPAEEPAKEEPEKEEPSEEKPAEEPVNEAPSEEAPAKEPSNDENPVAAITDLFMPVTVYAAENEVHELSDGEKRVLKDVKWVLNRDKSAYGSVFQAEIEGDVFIYEPDIKAYGLKSDAPLPEIRVTIISAGEEKEEVTEESEEIKLSPAFSQFAVAGSMRIKVDADPGVFPEGAFIRVRKVSGDPDREKIEEAVRNEVGDEGEISLSSYDITVLDADGNEIQPDINAGSARVSFTGIDSDSTYIYHLDDGLNSAEKLDASIEGDSATVNAGHFSVFTVVTVFEEDAESEPPILGKSVLDESAVKKYITENNFVYDREAHDALTVSSDFPEDQRDSLSFRLSTMQQFSKDIPKITDAGTYITTVSCAGLPEMVFKSIVSPKEIKENMVTASDSFYMGKAVENAVVTDGGAVLEKDTDYTAAYSNNVNPGTATVTISGKGNYSGTVKLEFKIIKYNGTYKFRYNGKTTPDEWYNDSVTITADGYKLSDSADGPFEESYLLSGSTKEVSKALYLTVSGDGIIPAMAGPVNFDMAPPKATLKVKGKSYSTLQNEKKILAYTNEGQSVSITGEDVYGGSGLKNTYYYITNKCYTNKSDLKEAAGDKWEEYFKNSKPGLTENKLNFAYAKVVDRAGNEYFVSSQGIWYDTKKPKVTDAKAEPKDTTAQLAVKGSDSESGILSYYCVVKKKGESKPKAADVKNTGLKTADGQFEISGLKAQTAYIAYCVIEDKAGNLSEVKEAKINTKEDKSSENAGAAGSAGAAAAKGAAGGAGGAAGAAGGAAGAAGGAGGSAAGSAAGGKSTVDERIKAGEAVLQGAGEEAIPETDVKDRVPYIMDATEGILIGRENTSGWDRIERETTAAETPAKIVVDMNGGTLVPESFLKDISERDMTVRLNMNEDLSWTVNGLSFAGSPDKDIDFKVRTNTKNIPSALINEVADVYPHINLTLEHSGDFGFTAILDLMVGKDKKGMFANLYYYNEENNSLEFVSSADVDVNGRATFEFTHASDYTVIVRGDALTEKSAAALKESNAGGTGNGGNGDYAAPAPVKKNSHRLWLIIISIVSFLLCGIILFAPDNRKRKPAFGQQ